MNANEIRQMLEDHAAAVARAKNGQLRNYRLYTQQKLECEIIRAECGNSETLRIALDLKMAYFERARKWQSWYEHLIGLTTIEDMLDCYRGNVTAQTSTAAIVAPQFAQSTITVDPNQLSLF